MRLLQCIDNGEFTFTKDLVGDDVIPPYAILSHTWKDGEEVTFEEWKNGAGKGKKGYKKIQFCGEQAKRDSLRHFWVDTCCINKSDQVELQDAINSMFRWYEGAAHCYVYLSDVSTKEHEVSDGHSGIGWGPSFRASRWFTRGWTLQELLAPRSVKFYSSEGVFLGDKRALERDIFEITELPTSAFLGTSLSQFSVEERFSWAKRRQTTRKEDRAYSLLGILGLFMSPNYGEGEENAFRRLQKKIKSTKKDQECIKDLRVTDPQDDKRRIEDTKGGLLEDSYRWVFYNTDFQQWRDSQQGRLLWIKGDPGKGKTMLLCGIADELKKSLRETEVLSYFFCQATDARINSATAVLRGLMYMLVIQQPLLILHIRKKHDDAGRALFEDANAWVALSEIFINVLHDLGNTYFIIDALDECVIDQKKLLDFIAQQSSTSPRIKWIISSRNWPDIEERLAKASQGTKLSLELNKESVSAAVDLFIKEKVRQLSQEKAYDTKTAQAVQQYLSLKANGTFLWVALVCQSLKDTAKRNVVRKLNTFPPDLGLLYQRMMQQIISSDDADICKEILALVATAYRPLKLEELAALVEQLEDEADELSVLQDIINHCGSFLAIQDKTVYFVHQSAKDFLLDVATVDIFHSGKQEVNRALFSRSLQVISSTLRRDLYDLHKPGCLIDQVEPPDPDPLRASRYSCIYWIDHLCDSISPSYGKESFDQLARDSITTFVRQKYLYWLEALSLCKAVSKGVASMTRLEATIKDIVDTSELHRLVQDACRFIMYHKGAIESAPLQGYMSAVIFSPTGSLIRNLFRHEAPKDIIVYPGMTDDWSKSLLTLEGHSGMVMSVIFSHDATQLASASADGTVKIWNAGSGVCLQTLKGHRRKVNSVAYSHNSTQLASASHDGTIKIWDTVSGVCLQTLEVHRSHLVNSVAYSHDSTQPASASDEHTVRIWDAVCEMCLETPKVYHSHSVNSVAYSHDSTYLASGSFDGTIKIWDAVSGMCLQTLEARHSRSVNSVAYSHDSTYLASASFDETVKIWEPSNNECLHTLRGHSGWVKSVAFSHNSTRLASASFDETVRIWDVGSGTCLQVLKSHSDIFSSAVFSHDSTRLATASHKIVILDVSSGECLQMLEGHSDILTSVAFSSDSTRLASSGDKTVKIWNIGRDAYLDISDSHDNRVDSIAFSHDSILLASASRDKMIKIWDTISGACLHTLRGHSDWVNFVAFSCNSAWLASASNDKKVRIWDVNSGACLQMFEEHGNVNSVAFSYDSTWLASASGNNVRIWNIGNGTCLHKLEGHKNTVWSVVYSRDLSRLASGSTDYIVKIWNTNDGLCLYTLEGHSRWIRSIAFSYDSTVLASASDDGTVRIWDASSNTCLQILKVSMYFSHISFDYDNSLLHTNAGTIRIARPIIPTASPIHQTPQFSGLGLSPDATWITYNSEKFLWLPSDYRPGCLAISGNMIGIGNATGKARIFKFNPDLLKGV